MTVYAIGNQEKTKQKGEEVVQTDSTEDTKKHDILENPMIMCFSPLSASFNP